MKKAVVFLIVVNFLCCSEVWAQQIHLTIDEAIALALRDNRDILLKSEDVKKAKLKIAESRADIFPSINFTASLTDTRGYYTKDIDSTSTQSTIKQYLYKGGKTTNTIEQDRYKLAVKEALLDKSRLEIALNVKKAFYALLLSMDFRDLNKSILENTMQHLDYAKARYRSGEASMSDVLKIESSLGNIRQVYEVSFNQAESGAVLLKNLLYLDEKVDIVPDSKFVYEPRDIEYDKALLAAVGARPEIKQYGAQESADRKAIEIAKADNRPSVYASWDYYSRSHASATTTRGWNDYNVIGLTFSWPIFDGWATKAKVEQAIVDLRETQLLKEKTVRDISQELKDSYLSLKNAISKVEAVESELVLYSDNLSTAKQRYEEGIVSLLDMSDAALKYGVSEFNKKQAIYDCIISRSNLDKATGGM
jgi:outer membrane protein TolC